MKRSLALLAVVAVLWALGSTWYYDCKIKRVCGPETLELVPQSVPVVAAGASVPAAVPVDGTVSVGAVESAPVAPVSAAVPSSPDGTLTVSFDARSAAVLPPPDIDAKLEMLRQGVAAGQKILVRGHSDGRGARERIALVSRQRAESLRDWLLTQGFTADSIAGVESREDRDPIANNGQAEGRAKNRRAEALLVPSP